MTTATEQTGPRVAMARAHLDRSSLAKDGGGDEPLTFVASTAEMNRYGFSLRNEGWRLANYNANPVFLWMHDPFTPPIGSGRALSDGERIRLADVTFDRADPLAAAVERKYRLGYMSAVSVSWDFVKDDGAPVLDWWRLKDEEIRDELFYDLAEVSAVTVPGDPRAVREQQARLAALSRELGSLLDERDRGTALADQVAAAVRAELTRLGIDPAKLTTPPPAPPMGEPVIPYPADTAAVEALRSLTFGGNQP